MPRKYSRKYPLYRSPRPKWCPVNGDSAISMATIGGQNYITAIQPICVNPSRNEGAGSTPTVTSASIITVTRIRYQGINATVLPLGISYIYFIAYVPEGIVATNATTSVANLGNSFFYRHPEWIMAWQRIDYSAQGENNDVRLNTGSLKRKLNTGDSIVLGIMGINRSGDYTQQGHLTYGTYSFFTKNN